MDRGMAMDVEIIMDIIMVMDMDMDVEKDREMDTDETSKFGESMHRMHCSGIICITSL
jgi:hypothetical protein